MIKTYFLDVISKHYFDFKGCANRKQFWLFMLFNVFILAILTLIGEIGKIISYIYISAVFFPSLGITIRRLREALNCSLSFLGTKMRLRDNGIGPWLFLICILISILLRPTFYWLGSQGWTSNPVVPDLGEGMNLLCYIVIPVIGFHLPFLMVTVFVIVLFFPSEENC